MKHRVNVCAIAVAAVSMLGMLTMTRDAAAQGPAAGDAVCLYRDGRRVRRGRKSHRDRRLAGWDGIAR